MISAAASGLWWRPTVDAIVDARPTEETRC
jgi:hypothetical protein